MSFITGFCILRENRIITARRQEVVPGDTAADFLDSLYGKLGVSYPKFYKMDPQSKLGFLASEILLGDRSVKAYAPDAVAVVLSNANASLDTDRRFEQTLQNTASPSLFVYTLPNIVMGEICIRHGITGENAFFITPAFDAALLSRYVNQVLLQPHVKGCLAGWVDVLGENYDVFLYLVEKQKQGLGIEHNPAELEKIYTQYYGTVDGGS